MKKNYRKILVIQTAFIGDVILATAVIEKLHSFYPDAEIFILVKKGYESLFAGHPFLADTWVWEKGKYKYRNLWQTLQKIRIERFDLLINLHRFASSGFLMAFSGAREKYCFRKNPFWWLASRSFPHKFQKNLHEVERNHQLIAKLTDEKPAFPRLYPTATDYESIKPYLTDNYICIAPASVWATKQFPAHKWVEFIRMLFPSEINIYLLGAKQDSKLCERIIAESRYPFIQNLAGKLSLLQSAALMKTAKMNYVNDSAPLHLASAVNAPVCAIFCSTIPDFGFFPLAEKSYIVETSQKLRCRPCGLHGYKACPQEHFACGETIAVENLVEIL